MDRLLALELRWLFRLLIVLILKWCDVLVISGPEYVASGFAGYAVREPLS